MENFVNKQIIPLIIQNILFRSTQSSIEALQISFLCSANRLLLYQNHTLLKNVIYNKKRENNFRGTRPTYFRTMYWSIVALDQVTLTHRLWELDQQERWCQTSWSSGPIPKIPKIPKNLNIRGYENSLTEMYVGFVGIKGRLKEALVITNPLKCQLYINNFFNIIFLFINRIEFMINTVVQKSGSRLKKRWLRSRL